MQHFGTSILFFIFQSTPSTRRETAISAIAGSALMHFNPLPPHGGRRERRFFIMLDKAFQSTPSTRRETEETHEKGFLIVISIHSLHTEGDRTERRGLGNLPHFNPLPPHGGRLGDYAFRDSTGLNFNPLPPHGGRPQNCTGKRFSFRLSLYNPAKKDAKDYILHPKK